MRRSHAARRSRILLRKEVYHYDQDPRINPRSGVPDDRPRNGCKPGPGRQVGSKTRGEIVDEVDQTGCEAGDQTGCEAGGQTGRKAGGQTGCEAGDQTGCKAGQETVTLVLIHPYHGAVVRLRRDFLVA